MTAFKPMCAALLVAALAGMGGCSRNGDLTEWLAAESKVAKVNVKPLPERVAYEAEKYEMGSDPDPFSKARMEAVLRRMTANVTPEIAAEFARERGDMEILPLEQIAMTGALLHDGRMVGLVRIGGQTRQVKVGDHLGANYGLVTQINETYITVNEIALNYAGEWVRQPNYLRLQAKKVDASETPSPAKAANVTTQ